MRDSIKIYVSIMYNLRNLILVIYIQLYTYSDTDSVHSLIMVHILTYTYVCMYLICTLFCSLQGGCVFVTVLLHYFFLAAFCWMLCEGIMLYLMLVVVFSRLSKKWWFFLLLGWGKLRTCSVQTLNL